MIKGIMKNDAGNCPGQESLNDADSKDGIGTCGSVAAEERSVFCCKDHKCHRIV